MARLLFGLTAAAVLVSASFTNPAISLDRKGGDRAPKVGNRILLPDPGGTVVYSTTSVKCGNTVYEVSTGTNGGACGVNRFPGQPTQGANCKDGNNAAEANCQTGCGTTSGAGSCTIKAAAQ